MNPIVLPTVCALDCPDACSLLITVENGRVTHLAGDPEHPITRGFACAKMVKYPERQEQSDRILMPQRRVGKKGEGKFEETTWESALDEIASKTKSILSQSGGQSVLPYHYAGTMGVLEGQSPLSFFRAIGALELDQTICASTGGTAWEMNYGPNKLGTDPEDLQHSKWIILWGINALRSNSHLAPMINAARKQGCEVLHIDPFRNETSRFSDMHWQIRVGTDAALALAMAHEIIENGWHDEAYMADHAIGFDEFRDACRSWTLERAADYCGLELSALQEVTREFALSPAPFIKVGYGLTRNEGGGNALRAITLLPALIGAWKRKGGGACLSTSGAFQLNTSRIRGEHLLRSGVRHVNMNRLASELHDTASNIRALFVFNSNPAAVAPDSARIRSGLENPELFTVVLDHLQTDTADFADYLLPATTFLEHPDVYTSYGHYYLQYSEPVVSARGQAKSNRWVFAELAKRLELKDTCLDWSPREVVEELLRSTNPWLQGITAEQLIQNRNVKLNLPEEFRAYSNGSNYADNKIRFSPPPKQLEFAVQTSSEFPLRLISPPGPYILNTSMGNVSSIIKMAGGEPQVIVHPGDASRAGVVHGERIVVTSATGSIQRKAIVSDDAREGTVIALGQWWPKLAPDRKGLNEITDERLTDIGGGSTFGNLVVRIEKTANGL